MVKKTAATAAAAKTAGKRGGAAGTAAAAPTKDASTAVAVQQRARRAAKKTAAAAAVPHSKAASPASGGSNRWELNDANSLDLGEFVDNEDAALGEVQEQDEEFEEDATRQLFDEDEDDDEEVQQALLQAERLAEQKRLIEEQKRQSAAAAVPKKRQCAAESRVVHDLSGFKTKVRQQQQQDEEEDIPAWGREMFRTFTRRCDKQDALLQQLVQLQMGAAARDQRAARQPRAAVQQHHNDDDHGGREVPVTGNTAYMTNTVTNDGARKAAEQGSDLDAAYGLMSKQLLPACYDNNGMLETVIKPSLTTRIAIKDVLENKAVNRLHRSLQGTLAKQLTDWRGQDFYDTAVSQLVSIDITKPLRISQQRDEPRWKVVTWLAALFVLDRFARKKLRFPDGQPAHVAAEIYVSMFETGCEDLELLRGFRGGVAWARSQAKNAGGDTSTYEGKGSNNGGGGSKHNHRGGGGYSNDNNNNNNNNSRAGAYSNAPAGGGGNNNAGRGGGNAPRGETGGQRAAAPATGNVAQGAAASAAN